MREGNPTREHVRIVAVLWAVQGAASAVYFLLPAVLPFLKDEFHLSQSEVGGFVSVLNLGNVLLLVPSGFFVDRFGEKRFLAAGIGFMALACMGVPLIASPLWMLACLFCLGVGYSVTAPGTNRAILHWIPISWRASMLGIKQTAVTLGGVAAALSAPLVLWMGWRGVYVALGILVSAVAVLFLRVYGEAPAALRIAREERGGRESGLRWSLEGSFLRLCLAGFFLGGCQFSILAYAVLCVKESLRMSVTAAGMVLVLLQCAAAAARLAGGVVSDRFLSRRRRPVLLGYSLLSAVSLTAAACLRETHPGWLVYAVFCIVGMTGLGFNGVYLTLSMELAAYRVSGLATSLAVVSVMSGGIAAPPLLGALIDAGASYADAWMVLCAASLVAFLSLFRLREGRAAVAGDGGEPGVHPGGMPSPARVRDRPFRSG